MNTTPRNQEEQAHLEASTTIDDAFLDDEFIRLPADLAYWNARYADKLDIALKAKLRSEWMQAQVFIEKREELLAAGVKFTQAELEARVLLDERVQEKQLELVDAEVEKSRARGLCDSVLAKRDMIQSLGAKRRIEMQDPIVRQQEADRRHVRNEQRRDDE